MVQGLQLSTRLSQSMVLAPQLQQSLALLQAPTLELKALVEQELQQNPVLEEIDLGDTELREKSTDLSSAGTSILCMPGSSPSGISKSATGAVAA